VVTSYNRRSWVVAVNSRAKPMVVLAGSPAGTVTLAMKLWDSETVKMWVGGSMLNSQTTSTPDISMSILMTTDVPGGQMGLLRVRHPSNSRMSYLVSVGKASCSLSSSSRSTVIVGNWAFAPSEDSPMARSARAAASRRRMASDLPGGTIATRLAL
jgi:hypothetical protein